MGHIARAKVYLRNKHGDEEKNFRDMLQEFKRQVNNASIMHDYKEHQYFESKSVKKRKRKREFEKKLKLLKIEQDILSGKKVKAPAGVIKKILKKHKKLRKFK